MFTRTTTRNITRWSDSHGNTFKVTAVYAPNEEPDTWVKYHNERTGQEYSCRREAFEQRFSPMPHDD